MDVLYQLHSRQPLPNYIPRSVGSLSIWNHHHLYGLYFVLYCGIYFSFIIITMSVIDYFVSYPSHIQRNLISNIPTNTMRVHLYHHYDANHGIWYHHDIDVSIRFHENLSYHSDDAVDLCRDVYHHCNLCGTTV